MQIAHFYSIFTWFAESNNVLDERIIIVHFSIYIV